MISSPERIPVAGPWITEREVELTAEAARTAWFKDHYRFNARFERTFADYVGTAQAVSLPHATAALHLALAALGVGPGDEVIIPDVTWIASAAPITYVGAEPVFVDIDPLTWCVDPAAIEAAIGPRTRAIIGVDLYGSMCEWDRIEAIARRNSLHMIEDAAEALGSSLRGRRAGSFGDASAFSFHGSKTLATGEGGMLATSNAPLMARVLSLRDHGRAPGDRFFLNYEIGFKYRMNAVTAALGLAQIERIDELVAYKRRIFGWYKERLAGIDGIAFNAEPEGHSNSFWMVTIVPDEDYGLDKFALMAAFDRRNIDTRPFFSQLSTLPAFDAYRRAKRFVGPHDRGAAAAKRGINLPSGYHVNEATVDLVCRALREILSEAKRHPLGGAALAQAEGPGV